jgi:hypothetical protein
MHNVTLFLYDRVTLPNQLTERHPTLDNYLKSSFQSLYQVCLNILFDDLVMLKPTPDLIADKNM